ncbi:hypothetical protein HA402_014878 [Bradysia odoriphaga]|nr:hypothetical protein HA402_014878 [Bradysia odoriphaga]
MGLPLERLDTHRKFGSFRWSLYVILLECPAEIIEQPFFDDISPRNVTTVVDDTVVLKCRVKNKGNRTVSWMRKRDLHILTSNIYTYTGDQRFDVIHAPESDDWDLKIEYAQQRDSGIYECQVNTEPKINLAVYLEVTGSTARARIMGSQEVHVKRGSTISLSCAVNVHASSVSWFHGSSVVDFDSARGGISLETEKTESGTSSRLMLTRAALRDSGNYTCVPAGAVSASVLVYVLNDDTSAVSSSYTSESAMRVAVEGNIGSGKSTFLEYCASSSNYAVYPEPVETCEDVNGVNLVVILI